MRLSNIKTAAFIKVNSLLKRLGSKQLMMNTQQNFSQNDLSVDFNKDCENELITVSNFNHFYFFIKANKNIWRRGIKLHI
jgi:hypothetical protein